MIARGPSTRALLRLRSRRATRRGYTATRRGYTVVELMMALVVLAVGVTGIVSMQKATITANQHAKNLVIATHIAQAWHEQLAADAVQWNHPSPRNNVPDLANDTVWLGLINATPNQWLSPVYNAGRDFGAAFDALGNPIGVTDGALDSPPAFCAHFRLRWLYPDGQPIAGNGMIRTEVRVFWQRDLSVAGLSNGANICAAANVAAVSNPAVGPQLFHFVYKTSAVRQSVAL